MTAGIRRLRVLFQKLGLLPSRRPLPGPLPPASIQLGRGFCCSVLRQRLKLAIFRPPKVPPPLLYLTDEPSQTSVA